MKVARNSFLVAPHNPLSSHGSSVLPNLLIFWSIAAICLLCPNPLPATEADDLISKEPLDEELLENLSLLSEVWHKFNRGIWSHRSRRN